mgnify:CR=1 FL=1
MGFCLFLDDVSVDDADFDHDLHGKKSADNEKGNEGDDDTAELLNGLMFADMYTSNGQEALDNAFGEGASGGMAAWRLRNDYEDESDPDNDHQRICIDPVVDADQRVFFDIPGKPTPQQPNPKPYSAVYCELVLLDEIEKAHSDVFNILLQVMDHGTLTDNNGRKADFRNVILIMTTNAGAEALNKPNIGFSNTRASGDEMADIKRLFSPEFRNRLDAIVPFAPLNQEVILRVVDKFLMQLEDQLHEKRVEATFTDALRAYLGKAGFDPLMGARPMQRLIQDTLRRALADELLFGKLLDGGSVTVDVDDKDQVVLTFGEASPKTQSRIAGSDQETELVH